jgi:hypothetical protein
MMEMIDSPAARHAYAQRMGIVEPVFGNIDKIAAAGAMNRWIAT